MKQQFISIPLTLLAAFLSSATEKANADLITVVGSWSYEINGDGFVNQTFTGSTTFQYDDSSLTGVGIEIIDNIPLVTFSQSPSPIGSTVFNTLNTIGRVVFNGGAISNTAVGGLPLGASNVDLGADDFRVVENLPGLGGPFATISNGTGPSGAVNGTSVAAIFSHTAVVPEPSTALLGALACAGLMLRRRRQS